MTNILPEELGTRTLPNGRIVVFCLDFFNQLEEELDIDYTLPLEPNTEDNWGWMENQKLALAYTLQFDHGLFPDMTFDLESSTFYALVFVPTRFLKK